MIDTNGLRGWWLKMEGICQVCSKRAELDKDKDGKMVCENCWSYYGKREVQ